MRGGRKKKGEQKREEDRRREGDGSGPQGGLISVAYWERVRESGAFE